MRSLSLSLLVIVSILALAACSGPAGSGGTPAAEPSAALQPTADPLSALPSLADLDRLASAAGSYNGGGDCLLIAQSASGVSEDTFGWDIEPEDPAILAWAVLASGPWKAPEGDEAIYQFLRNSTSQDPEGQVWYGVADWQSGRWQWFDALTEDWLADGSGLTLGSPLDKVGNPVSPSGSIYAAVVAYGSGSSARANLLMTVGVAYDEPYLEAPVITELERNGEGARVKFDPGPDSHLLNSSDQKLYVCEGAVFNEELAVNVETPNGGGGWRGAGGPYSAASSWTFAMRCEYSVSPGSSQPGKWGLPVTLAPVVEE